MDTPVDKTQLLEWITASRAELDAVIAPLSDAQMTAPGAEGELSVKDLLAHVSWWERRTLRALAYAARGEAPPKLAAEGEGEAGVNRVNAETFADEPGSHHWTTCAPSMRAPAVICWLHSMGTPRRTCSTKRASPGSWSSRRST